MPGFKPSEYLSSTPPYLFYDDNTPYDFTCDVGAGWKDLCVRTFGKIAAAYIKHNVDMSQFYVVQIKEKFGGIRIYLGGMKPSLYEDVDDIVANAEDESLTICEVCGKPGEPRRGGWIKTLCDQCAI